MLTKMLTPDFKTLHPKQIKEYIENSHAKKLDISNYLPHHGVCNVNKPHQRRVIYDASAKYQGTSLNQNLLPGLGLLNNLISVLTIF